MDFMGCRLKTPSSITSLFVTAFPYSARTTQLGGGGGGGRTGKATSCGTWYVVFVWKLEGCKRERSGEQEKTQTV